MSKRALITGIAGQDGSYLAEWLLDHDYEVYGLVRRVNTDSLMRLEHVKDRIHLLRGNMLDTSTIEQAIRTAHPHEIYNLAAQSHVGDSFDCPEETREINYFGLGRVVDEVLDFDSSIRVYQASTGEMFGSTPPPQHEGSAFEPVSPYGKAKLRAHQNFVEGYRTRHNLFICSGFLFNHESPRRSKQFVTRKITHSMAKIEFGLQESFSLGNLDARRDWGYAGDYVQAMWLMLQRKKPEDYVLATGESHTVREFVEEVARVLGVSIRWEGNGAEEKGWCEQLKRFIVSVDPEYYRPQEVHDLRGDAHKAHRDLGWHPTTKFQALVRMMALSDLELVSKKII